MENGKLYQNYKKILSNPLAYNMDTKTLNKLSEKKLIELLIETRSLSENNPSYFFSEASQRSGILNP